MFALTAMQLQFFLYNVNNLPLRSSFGNIHSFQAAAIASSAFQAQYRSQVGPPQPQPNLSMVSFFALTASMNVKRDRHLQDNHQENSSVKFSLCRFLVGCWYVVSIQGGKKIRMCCIQSQASKISCERHVHLRTVPTN